MSNYIVDQNGFQVWYDLIANIPDYIKGIRYIVYPKNIPAFYVRYHREDGPALIKPHTSEHYYFQGKRHRDDGPAVEYHDGSREWWGNDKLFIFDGWCKELDKSSEEITYLKIKWDIK